MSEFFAGRKRGITLDDLRPKLNAQNEQRMGIDFQMVLDEEMLQNSPEAINNAYSTVAVVENGIVALKIGTEFGAHNLELYETPQQKRPTIVIPAAVIRDIRLTRDPEKENGRTVILRFGTTVPCGATDAGEKLLLWLWQHFGKLCFANFIETQPPLEEGKDGKKAAAGDDED